VADVAKQLGAEPRQLVKTLIFKMRDSGDLVAAVIPGDRELNELKLAKVLGGAPQLLKDDEFAERGIAKGFSDPWVCRWHAGRPLARRRDERRHRRERSRLPPDRVVAGRDFKPEVWADLITVMDGDICDRCGGTLQTERGIEVGHIFQLVAPSTLPNSVPRLPTKRGPSGRS